MKCNHLKLSRMKRAMSKSFSYTSMIILASSIWQIKKKLQTHEIAIRARAYTKLGYSMRSRVNMKNCP